ncbi:MAG: class I SAM-dependent methyltransferase [Candidatus Aminicenantales bacterium]
MATDINLVINNLLAFYDFSRKRIISVGSGGGQLASYGKVPESILAVDHDQQAIEQLKERVKALGLENKYEFLCGDYYQLKQKADAVLFEFCLHEMADAAKAIAKAVKMAKDIIVIDHALESEWAYIVSEEEKVKKTWQALEKFSIYTKQTYNTRHLFHDYRELYDKVAVQGEITVKRIKKFRKARDFSIPFSYTLAWLR